ncbi:MAG: quinohemoprotein amine dehydrogenase subunit alpha [Acidobacteriia bacterium]|nr:quinohemoprotein amine dehydrogenase subunit alpha [Terriglobia bacterium]
MNRKQGIGLLTLLWSLLACAVAVQAEGLPIKSQLVRDTCGACHQVDSEQRMSRISYVRKTPEGWEETIRRMVRLHKLQISPADARQVVQYLADNQGLTASELDKISYALEFREQTEQIPNDAVKAACATCHSYAKIAAQRRSREEWFKLKDFLLAMFPTIVYQHRQIDWTHTADEALAWLADQYPLETPEWRREKGQPPPGAGRWLVIGHQPGQGDYAGIIRVTDTPDGGRQTQTSVEFADGTRMSSSGKGRWFGGYSWRGSSEWQDGRKAREVMHLSADGKVLRGRWFILQHTELGAEEVRYRIEEGQARLAAVFPQAVKRGATVALMIYGANLPDVMKPGALNLGDGITIEKISEASAEKIIVQAKVSPDAKIGLRDVRAGAVTGAGLLAVYDAVDYLRVSPQSILARVGGERYPKKFAQFEAHAFSNGADGVAGSADDLDLGPVKASWKLGEAFTSYDDNDLLFVGSIDQNGLFTPAVEGPNPARRRSTNNAGDVWAEASYTPVGASQELKARAFLLVSVPVYRMNLIP